MQVKTLHSSFAKRRVDKLVKADDKGDFLLDRVLKVVDESLAWLVAKAGSRRKNEHKVKALLHLVELATHDAAHVEHRQDGAEA